MYLYLLSKSLSKSLGCIDTASHYYYVNVICRTLKNEVAYITAYQIGFYSKFVTRFSKKGKGVPFEYFNNIFTLRDYHQE